MNFTDFNKDLSEEFDLTQQESKKILSFLQKRIKDRLIFGVDISIREVGTFTRAIRKPKPYLNLQTNKMQVAPRRYFLKFVVKKTMADKLKKKTLF